MARFYIDVESAGDQRPRGKFKVVAFAENAKHTKRMLEKRDQVLLVGYLLERKEGRGVEIRLINFIPFIEKEIEEE